METPLLIMIGGKSRYLLCLLWGMLDPPFKIIGLSLLARNQGATKRAVSIFNCYAERINMRIFQYLTISLLCLCSGSLLAVDGCPDEAIAVGVQYDSRPFLSITQRNSFKSIYPEFDEDKPHKDWEWKDVDPLGFFSASENRSRRRDNFLFEYSPDVMLPVSGEVTSAQKGFRELVKAQIAGAVVMIDSKNMKIISPYAEGYEKDFPACNLMEKLATLGLQWAQTGGHNLYIYNGRIFLGSFKSGWVSIANHNIDKPPVKLRMKSNSVKKPEKPNEAPAVPAI